MMLDLSWMAWTQQTATFFIVIAIFILLMALWEMRHPGGSPRRGLLRIVTTRGDRLFISLLVAAYIHLGWLLFTDWHLGHATLISAFAAVFIFRRV